MGLKLEDLLRGRQHSANDNSESLSVLSSAQCCMCLPTEQFLSLHEILHPQDLNVTELMSDL